ncbi:MAG: flagellar hook-length control protein FliK [Gammaproteobacteria bacterium]|nr:MAG: flagellar hook-length control protein FliK [Gammaproteobacteria bacterium]
MPEVISSLPVQPQAANPPQADGAVSAPGGAQAGGAFAEVLTARLAAHTTPEGGGLSPDGEVAGGNNVQPDGRVLPEPSFAAASGMSAGDGAEGLINPPPSAADKGIMQPDEAIDNVRGEAAEQALPLPASAVPAVLPAAVQAPPVNVAEDDNVAALRTAGAKILPPKGMLQDRDQTASFGLTQEAAQDGQVERSTLELIKSRHDIAASPARVDAPDAAGQISAPLLLPANSPADSNGQATAGVATAPAVPVMQQTNPAPVNAPVSLQLPLPLEQRGWGESLGHRVLWMVRQEHQIAELQLNPPHLGPLELRVTVDQDEASVAFSTQHAMVRDALEAALPRLREMLGASGLTLGQVNISQQSFAEQRESRYGGNDYPRSAVRNGNNVTDETPSMGLLRPSHGVIDLYA